MHENVGAQMCTAVDVKKKKGAYNTEHSCIARQRVIEHSEKMDVSTEQYCAIKVCVCLKNTLSETTTLLKETFGKEMQGDSTI